MITELRVGLKQSSVHKYPVEIASGKLEPIRFRNMTSGLRS